MAERDQATHDPTVAHRRQAERGGQFARSRELAVSITWLAGVALLATLGSALWRWMREFGATRWSEVDISLPAEAALRQNLVDFQGLFWTALFPVLGGVCLITALVWTAQNGFRFFPHLVAPDMQRLNPTRNLSRMLAWENQLSVFFGLLKFIVLWVVAGWVVWGDMQTLASWGLGSMDSQRTAISEWLLKLVQRLCLAALAIGLADFGVRWWKHQRSLRMTDQEMREEQRSDEPSPEIAARRRLQRTR